jgi:hypothetical protein
MADERVTEEQIRTILRAGMSPEFYSKSGAVLYGPASTLSGGSAYVMGLNPGGDPATIAAPIVDCVCAPDGTSAYTHECWRNGCGERCEHIGPDGRTIESALVRHQRNILALTKALGGTPTTVASVNAIFGRSKSLRTLRQETGHTVNEWWNACWPIHASFLAIVRPKVIVTLGYGENSSAFGLLRREAGHPSHRRFSDEGRRSGWAFNARFKLGADELETAVIGVPHPSYFAAGPVLSEKLRELVEGRLFA